MKDIRKREQAGRTTGKRREGGMKQKEKNDKGGKATKGAKIEGSRRHTEKEEGEWKKGNRKGKRGKGEKGTKK